MPAPISPPDDRLAAVVRSFTNCVDLDEALATMVREGLADLGVIQGVLTIVTPEGLVPVGSHGMDREVLDTFTPMPLSTELPLTAAARTGDAVFLASLTERDEQFPALAGHYVEDRAWAALPLRSGERTVGALGLTFAAPTSLTPEDRSFLHHVAAVCATAVDTVHSPTSDRASATQAPASSGSLGSRRARMAPEGLTPSRLVTGLAVAALLPLAITLALDRMADPLEILPGTWYLAAVMLSAALGGLAAGSLCVVLSAIGFWWVVLTPRQSFELTGEQGITLLAFLVVATIVEWVVHRLERAYSSMEATSRSLEETDARFRQAVELGGIGVVSGEGDVVTEANDAFLHLVGRTRAEVDAGELCWSEVVPTMHPVANAERVVPPSEQLLTHADGRRLAALVSTVVFDVARWRWSSFVVDLSERKSIEHRLRASELRHRSLVNATSSIVWTTSPQGEFVTPQPDWEAYTGHSWERHRGRGWLEAVHPDDRAPTTAVWRDCVTRGVPYETSYRLWHESTHDYRQVEAHAAPVLDEERETQEWIGTIVDVHDQRLAEARAQAIASEAQAREATARATARLARQLEAAQRIAHMGSWEWRADDDTVTWSREMFRIFGLPENTELRGPDDLDVHIHPDDRLPRSLARAEAVEHKKPFRYEKRVLRPEGDIRITVVSGEPILDDDNAVVGLRGTVHDVTEQREAQAQLDQAREELLRSELSRLHEHQVVRAMQEVALPATLPEVAGLEIAATYVPAEGDVEIGGDWYDAFVLDDGQVVVTVGDVSGHGVGAAAVMAHLRNGLRAYAYEGLDPAVVLGRLNRLLCRYDTDSFATAVVAFYHPTDRCLRWSQAGHPPPVLFGPEGTTLLTSPGCGGTVLGIWEDVTYDGCVTGLSAGSGVVFYTDGLIERRGETIDRGLGRLRHALDDREARGRSLPSLLDHLARTLIHEGGRDDTCQLAIRCEPSGSC